MSNIMKNLWGMSHTGYKRSRNEDRYLAQLLKNDQVVLLGVADGMGGEPGGDISAQIVIDTLQNYHTPSEMIEQDLNDILNQAGKKVRFKAEESVNLEGMGTTATIVLVLNGIAYWSHVGDSRLYLYRGGGLKQVTTDHTFVQDLVDDGTLSQYDADRHPLRNMLDQCVGCQEMNPDSGHFPVQPNDTILLCSDGLNLHVSDDEIKAALEVDSARTASEQLVRKALKAGGLDNVTVVVMMNKHTL